MSIDFSYEVDQLRAEAHAEITRLREENEKLREALGCQADRIAKGDPVSAAPLQSGSSAEAIAELLNGMANAIEWAANGGETILTPYETLSFEDCERYAAAALSCPEVRLHLGILYPRPPQTQTQLEERSDEGSAELDRGLPRQLTIHLCARDGLLSVFSDDVPDFYISGPDPDAVLSDIGPVLTKILADNYGKTVAEYCHRTVDIGARK